uniref:Myosin-9-like n=1 Tax=Strongyloides papillosus TaxID=174720 RepID=A0A0N5BRZ5_STREA
MACESPTGNVGYVQSRIDLFEKKIKEHVLSERREALVAESNLLDNRMKALSIKINSERVIKEKNDEAAISDKYQTAAISRVVCRINKELIEGELKLNMLNKMVGAKYHIIRKIRKDSQSKGNYLSGPFMSVAETVKGCTNEDGSLKNVIQSSGEFLRKQQLDCEDKLWSLRIQEKCLTEELSALQNCVLYNEECAAKRNSENMNMVYKKQLDNENNKREMEILKEKINRVTLSNADKISRICKLKGFLEDKATDMGIAVNKRIGQKKRLKSILESFRAGCSSFSLENTENLPEDVVLLCMEFDKVKESSDEVSLDLSDLTKQISKLLRDIDSAEKRLSTLRKEKSERVSSKERDAQDKLERFAKTTSEIKNTIQSNKLLMDKLNIRSDIEKECEKLKEKHKEIVSASSMKKLTQCDLEGPKASPGQREMESQNESLTGPNKKTNTRKPNVKPAKKHGEDKKSGPKVSSKKAPIIVVPELDEMELSDSFLEVGNNNRNNDIGRGVLSEDKLAHRSDQHTLNSGNIDVKGKNKPFPVVGVPVSLKSSVKNIPKEQSGQKSGSKRSSNGSHIFSTPAKLRTVEKNSTSNAVDSRGSIFKERIYSTRSVATNPEEYNKFVNGHRGSQKNLSSSPNRNFKGATVSRQSSIASNILQAIPKKPDPRLSLNHRRDSVTSSVMAVVCNLDDEGTSDSSLDDM